MLRDVEDIYLIFTGQMMVINKCRLLSVSEQQEQNAQVYACYYKKKFELKKLEMKKKMGWLFSFADQYYQKPVSKKTKTMEPNGLHGFLLTVDLKTSDGSANYLTFTLLAISNSVFPVIR